VSKFSFNNLDNSSNSGTVMSGLPGGVKIPGVKHLHSHGQTIMTGSHGDHSVIPASTQGPAPVFNSSISSGDVVTHSVHSSAVDIHAAAGSFTSHMTDIMLNVMSPLVDVTTGIARVMGILFILVGIMRLHRHAHHHMMHRLSPIATAMFFFVGATLGAYGPILGSLANSAFNKANPQMFSTCAVKVNDKSKSGATSGVTTTKRSFCPIIGYVKEEQKAASLKGGDKNKAEIKIMAFALLFIVGLISFFRGMILLVRLGEGSGGEGSMLRPVMHLGAGVFGVNAQAFYNIVHGVIVNN